MFRTDLLSIFRSFNTLLTANGIWCLTWKNDQVFQRAKEERLLLKILKNRRHSWRGHAVGHNEFVVNILEGAISGKKAVGRPGLQYLKQVARNTGADSYTAMERMACNNSRWKAANQSKDWKIRRRNGAVEVPLHLWLQKPKEFSQHCTRVTVITVSALYPEDVARMLRRNTASPYQPTASQLQHATEHSYLKSHVVRRVAGIPMQ